jgi:hypothetical protein
MAKDFVTAQRRWIDRFYHWYHPAMVEEFVTCDAHFEACIRCACRLRDGSAPGRSGVGLASYTSLDSPRPVGRRWYSSYDGVLVDRIRHFCFRRLRSGDLPFVPDGISLTTPALQLYGAF